MSLRNRLYTLLAFVLIAAAGLAQAGTYRSFIEWNGPYFNVRHALNSDSSAYLDYSVNNPLPLFGSPFSSPTAVEAFGSVTTPSVFVVDRDQRRVQAFTVSAAWRVESLTYSATPVQGNFGGASVKFSLGETVPSSERVRINGKFFRRVNSLAGYSGADSVYVITNSGAPNAGGVVTLPTGWLLTTNDSVWVEYAYATPAGTPGVGDIDYILTSALPSAIPLQLNEATETDDPDLSDLSSIALNSSVRAGQVADVYLVNSLSGGAGSLFSYELNALGNGGQFNFIDEYPGLLARPVDVEIVETDINTDGSVVEGTAGLVNNARIVESINNQNTFLGHDYRITFSFDTASTMNQANAPDNQESDLAFDPATGILHMVFTKDDDTYGCSYSSSLDYGRTWTEAVRISPLSLTGAKDRPRIAIRSNGEIHVVYEALVGADRQLFHSYSVDGETWSTNTNLTSTITPSTVTENRYANLLVDPSSNVHLIWAGDDDVYHRIFSGSTWGAITQVAVGTNTGYSAPHCVMSSSGRIYMAFVSDAGAPSKISYLLYNGVNWGSYDTGGFTAAVDLVTNDAGVASETSVGETFPFPQIAISGNSVWVFWVGQGTEAWPVATNIYYNRIDALDAGFTSGSGTAISAAAETASPQRFTVAVDDLGNIHIVYPFASTADQDGLAYKVYDPANDVFSPTDANIGREIYAEGLAATTWAYEPRLICPTIAGQVVPMLSCGKAWTGLDAGTPRVVFKIIDGVVTVLDQTELSEINQFLVWTHGVENSTAIPGLSFTISNSSDAISVTDDVNGTEFNVGPTENYFDLDGTAPEKNDNLFVTDADLHRFKVLRAYDNIDNCFGGGTRWDVPGYSDGTPLQTFKLGTVGGEGTYTVWASADSTPWTIVNDILIAGTTDRVCEVDRFTGELRFGDGSHGLIPPAGVYIRVRYSESVDQAEAGSQGSALGQLNLPNGIAARYNNNLGQYDVYICDTGNNRLQKFEYTPTDGVNPNDWISPVVTWNTAASASDFLSAPDDIEVIVQNNEVYLVVTDSGNDRIVIYHDTEATDDGGSTAPEFVATAGGTGNSLNQFVNPQGLGVMAEDSGLVIFCADADRDVVTKTVSRNWLEQLGGDSTDEGGSADNTLRLDAVDALDTDAYLLLQRGATRTIELYATRTDSLVSLRTVFSFPPALISVLSVNEGNLWTGERFTNKIFLYDYNNTTGRLEINASMVGDDDGMTVNSSRLVASIVIQADSFNVPATGTFAFTDAECQFRDVNNLAVSTVVLADLNLLGSYLGDIASATGTPGTPPSMVPAVDGRIDFADVNVFTQGWNGDGITFDPIADIGPYTGSSVPNLVAAPDARLDAYDLLSLSTMYNWYNSTVVAGAPERPHRAQQLDVNSPIVAVSQKTNRGWLVELQARDLSALTTAHLDVTLSDQNMTILSATNGGWLGNDALFLHTVRGNSVDICLGRLNPAEPEVTGSGTLARIEIASTSSEAPRLSFGYELRNSQNEIVAEGSADNVAGEPVPQQFGLANAYPNPFNASTTFTLYLPEAGRASLRLFNMLGQEVLEIANRDFPAGTHSIHWSARNAQGQDLPTGLYFVQLAWNGKTDVKKLALTR